MAQLEYEERSGKLTDTAKVKNDAFKANRILRDELAAIRRFLAQVKHDRGRRGPEFIGNC